MLVLPSLEEIRAELFDPAKEMFKYVFYGSILPLKSPFPETRSHMAFQAMDGNNVICIIEISDNKLRVPVESQCLDWLTVKNHVASLVQSILDCHGFVSGHPFELDIHSKQSDDDSIGHVNWALDELGLKPLNHDKVTMDELLLASTQEGGQCLMRSLADIRGAVRNPLDTGFHAYRSIEDIRQYFVDDSNNEKDNGWLKMRTALNIERSYMEPARIYGTPQRHGAVVPMSHDQRVEVILLAARITARFCKFLLALPEGFSTVPPRIE